MENSNQCSAGWGRVKGVLVLTPKQNLDLRIRLRDFDYFIGIDPGVVTGLAVWDKNGKKLTEVKSMAIHNALDRVQTFTSGVNRDRFLVRIEDARLRKWLPREKNESEYRGKLQGAGSVKRDCQIWESFLEDRGIIYELLAPAAGRTKWAADYFIKLTGYTGKTSNHGRDAAALVYGL